MSTLEQLKITIEKIERLLPSWIFFSEHGRPNKLLELGLRYSLSYLKDASKAISSRDLTLGRRVEDHIKTVSTLSCAEFFNISKIYPSLYGEILSNLQKVVNDPELLQAEVELSSMKAESFTSSLI